MCRKLSKSESTIVGNRDSQGGTTVDVYWSTGRSQYRNITRHGHGGERRSIGTGVM